VAVEPTSKSHQKKLSIIKKIKAKYESARKALQDGQTTEKKLGEMAKKLKLPAVLQKYWEAVVS
jgi:hypothetical protein